MVFFDQFGQQPIGNVDQINRAIKQARLAGPTAAPGMQPAWDDISRRAAQADPATPNRQAKGDLPFSYNPGPQTFGPDGKAADRLPSGLPTPAAPKQPMQQPAQPQAQPPAPQQPMQGEVIPPGQQPQAAPASSGIPPYVDTEKKMMRDTARVLIQNGSPAQRVQGLQMMMQSLRPSKFEEARDERARLMDAIERAPAEEGAKARARTLIELGGGSKEVMETLGFDAKGIAAGREMTESMVKVMNGYAQDMASVDILTRDEARVIEQMDRPMNEGLLGWANSFIPYSSADTLDANLQTFKSHIWKDYIQRMREASQTGAAVGQVTEKEGYWLQSMEGSLKPFQDPELLKQNMRGIIEGKKIFAELRLANEKMKAGDPEAAEQYVELTRKLTTLTQDIVERSRTEKALQAEVPTAGKQGKAIEERYGIK